MTSEAAIAEHPDIAALEEKYGDLASWIRAHATDPTPKRTECMHCGFHMSDGAEPVSHGVCDQCRPIHYPTASALQK